jgi:DNA-binding NarL/FixJ family response regulator
MIRVLLVDDQPAVRRGLRLRLALEPDLAVVGETGDAGEALILAQWLLPDVIVIDVAMPGVDGIEVVEQLRGVAPAAAVVILTLQGDRDTRMLAQVAGAHAFIEKQGGVEGLLQAIRWAAQHSTESVSTGQLDGDMDHWLQTPPSGCLPAGGAPV